MSYTIYFLLWLFFLYWLHRLAHVLPVIKKLHLDHHIYITQNQNVSWHWSNLFLITQTLKSTVDLWITEVIPTLLFSLITGQWWILIFYYLWAAILQETLEHDKNLNLPILTSGKWHLLHHSDFRKNFGIFFPLWDIVFNTYKKI